MQQDMEQAFRGFGEYDAAQSDALWDSLGSTPARDSPPSKPVRCYTTTRTTRGPGGVSLPVCHEVSSWPSDVSWKQQVVETERVSRDYEAGTEQRVCCACSKQLMWTSTILMSSSENSL